MEIDHFLSGRIKLRMPQRTRKFGISVLSVLLLAAALTSGAFAAGMPEKLVPMGNAVGITVKARGAIVVGINEEENGKFVIAKGAQVIPGDIITGVNGMAVESALDLTEAVKDCGKDEVSLQIIRAGEEKEVSVKLKEKDGELSLGVWVRDAMSGIGTVTYLDPESGAFGALGHAISDGDTGVIIPVKNGSVMDAVITDVTEGKSGAPGKLSGEFKLDDAIGGINENTAYGIFGVLDKAETDEEFMAVASPDEVKTGKAVIRSTVSGSEIKEYEIEIVKLYPKADDGRNMMIKITDESLIKATGGIVQGMSGSPIIQNGKIIGAVTHVLVSDPTRGYGIFIENMLEAAGYGEQDAA